MQAIASLPHLAVFSDEAHHTYGQSLDTELKKVRKTVDYLHHNSPNLICVVNTTGTPYFQRQPLRDVVIWYGLSQGIRDGILKPVAGNIQAFSFEGNVEAYLAHVIEDFFRDYGRVALLDGTPAKLAIYFPQTDDVEQLRPVIETSLASLGLPPTTILEHHTKKESKAEFDRFRLKDSPHRVALLVDRGVEGWDVPALFACALARRLKSSNNFVLQAACRCLRQVPGNPHKARIYLSVDNYGTLDRQLQETYGEKIADLNTTQNNSRRTTIKVRKLVVPPLVVRQIVRTVVPLNGGEQPASLKLSLPDLPAPTMTRYTLDIAEQVSTPRVLREVSESVTIAATPATMDVYAAAVELAAVYRTEVWDILDELKRLYPGGELPAGHLPELSRQVEAAARRYEVREETVEKALALLKLPGFEKSVEPDGTAVYTAEISYPVDREELLASWERLKAANKGDFGFHYDPYNFDSKPEFYFFEQLLEQINLQPDEIEDIYFTGAITSPDKTDFFVEYLGEDDRWHRYTPDFVIRRKDGRCYIVEVKREHDRAHPVDGENGRKAIAMQKWVGLNPDRLKYHMIFTEGDSIGFEQVETAARFLREPDQAQ